MSDRKYARPPIIEALVEIRFKALVPKSALEIFALLTSLRDDYPQTTEIVVHHAIGISGAGQGTPAPNVSVGNVLGGVRFMSKDATTAVDVMVDKLVVRTMKYEGWESFQPLALGIWEKFAEAIGGGVTERVAVRYTNRFDIPVSLASTSTLFNPSVDDPIGKNANLLSYGLLLTIGQPDIDSYVNMQRGIVASESSDIVSIVLDIDAYCDKITCKTSDKDMIWEKVECLHSRGKEYFEASITDDVRRMIDTK